MPLPARLLWRLPPRWGLRRLPRHLHSAPLPPHRINSSGSRSAAPLDLRPRMSPQGQWDPRPQHSAPGRNLLPRRFRCLRLRGWPLPLLTLQPCAQTMRPERMNLDRPQPHQFRRILSPCLSTAGPAFLPCYPWRLFHWPGAPAACPPRPPGLAPLPIAGHTPLTPQWACLLCGHKLRFLPTFVPNARVVACFVRWYDTILRTLRTGRHTGFAAIMRQVTLSFSQPRRSGALAGSSSCPRITFLYCNGKPFSPALFLRACGYGKTYVSN